LGSGACCSGFGLVEARMLRLWIATCVVQVGYRPCGRVLSWVISSRFAARAAWRSCSRSAGTTGKHSVGGEPANRGQHRVDPAGTTLRPAAWPGEHLSTATATITFRFGVSQPGDEQAKMLRAGLPIPPCPGAPGETAQGCPHTPEWSAPTGPGPAPDDTGKHQRRQRITGSRPERAPVSRAVSVW
jgi:hypothetical protein